MNLFRPQKTYRFRPPRQSAWFRPLLHLMTTCSLRWRMNIRCVTVHGDAELERLVRQGHAVLVAPNHADHADPALIIEVGRRRSLAFHFMAAREGFERGVVDEFVLQRSGAFSVDREGADFAAVKAAIGILRNRRNPLVIFPEGEIYHHHEELDDLNEGVASILLQAAEKLPDGARAYAVPTAIRITHDPEVADTFAPRLALLEQRLTLKPDSRSSIVDRIYRFGGVLLALKESEFTGRALDGELADRIARLQHFIVEGMEGKHGAGTGRGTIPARIKALRQTIRAKLHRGAPAPDVAESLYDDLDRIFAAHQLYSYSSPYLRQDPSVDRIAETIFKLEEDVLGVQRYPATRRAEISFGEAIDIRRFILDRNLTARSGVRPLTDYLRTKIQAKLARRA